jgi:SAM-dependent methyltransferase
MPSIGRRIVRKVAAAVRKIGPEPDWQKRKRRVDEIFDIGQGVDTGGITQLKGMALSTETWRDGFPHIAVDPAEFATAIEALDVDLSRFTFIDLGSGKGRALLLALDYPFQKIIGVEFAGPLVATARANLEKIGKVRDVSRVEVVHADAVEYDLPHTPALIFLYNPFGGDVMKRVARRTREALVTSRQEAVILYLNPFEVDCWLAAGFCVVHRGRHFAILRLNAADHVRSKPVSVNG